MFVLGRRIVTENAPPEESSGLHLIVFHFHPYHYLRLYSTIYNVVVVLAYLLENVDVDF